MENEEFRKSLGEWLDGISADLSRKIMCELDSALSRADDPRASEELLEIRQILNSAKHSWDHGDYESAGSSLDRVKERL